MPPKTNESTYPPEYTLGDIVTAELSAREAAKIIPAFSPDLRSRQIEDLVQDVLSKRVFSAPERPVRSSGHIISDDTNPNASVIENVQAEGRIRKPKRVRSAALITAAAFLAGGASSSDLSTGISATDGTNFSSSTSTLSSPNLSIIITPNSEAPTPAPSIDPNVAVVPPTPEAAPSPPAPTPEVLPPEPTIIPVGTESFALTIWNAKSDNKNIVDGIDEALHSSDITAVQEFSLADWQNVAPKLLHGCEGCGEHDGYFPQNIQTGEWSKSALFFNKTTFTPIDSGYVLLNKENKNLEKAAGGTDITERQLIYQAYEHKLEVLPNGAKYDREPLRIAVINIHTIASIEHKGAADTKNKERRAVFEREQMPALEALINQLRAAHPDWVIAVVGDFNYGLDANQKKHDDNIPNDDPYSPVEFFARMGFWCANSTEFAPKNGSHEKSGNRKIDQMWFSSPLKVKIMTYGETTDGSDHKRVTGVFQTP